MTTKLPRRITSGSLFDESLQDMFNFLDASPAFGMGKSAPSYPHINVSNINEDNHYNIEVALAGFGKENINVQFEPYKKSGHNRVKILSVTASKETKSSEGYIYQGIAERDASISLLVGQDDECVSCLYENGILVIKMKQVISQDDNNIYKIDVE